MKKRWTSREVALIMLPCIALGGLALWTRGKNLHTDKFEFTLQSVEVVPATPRDVYEGFDTLVKVKYRYPRRPQMLGVKNFNTIFNGPQKTRLTHKVRGEERTVVLPKGKEVASSVAMGGYNETVFRLNLSQMPLRYGELTLKTTVTGAYSYNAPDATGRIVSKDIDIPPLPISVVVRKLGEVVTTPEVSKVRPFVVRFIQPAPDFRNPQEYSLKIVTERTDDETQDAQNGMRWLFMKPRIEDGRGRKYVDYQKMGKKEFRIHTWFPASKDDDPRTNERVVTFPKDLLPKDAGRITFKAEVSLDDCWPLPISFVVRP